jgi:hypothetical protein
MTNQRREQVYLRTRSILTPKQRRRLLHKRNRKA